MITPSSCTVVQIIENLIETLRAIGFSRFSFSISIKWRNFDTQIVSYEGFGSLVAYMIIFSIPYSTLYQIIYFFPKIAKKEPEKVTQSSFFLLFCRKRFNIRLKATNKSRDIFFLFYILFLCVYWLIFRIEFMGSFWKVREQGHSIWNWIVVFLSIFLFGFFGDSIYVSISQKTLFFRSIEHVFFFQDLILSIFSTIIPLLIK